MVFFMVFLARSKVEIIDTMKGKLMLAWYRGHELRLLLGAIRKPATTPAWHQIALCHSSWLIYLRTRWYSPSTCNFSRVY